MFSTCVFIKEALTTFSLALWVVFILALYRTLNKI